MTGPLYGLKVIDLSTVVMGPYATQIMADMGAEVIKIEAPEGDVFRYGAPSIEHGMSAAYMQLNRNKHSLVLNLRAPADLAILKTLLADADVLVSNIRPQSMRRLGLAYEDLQPEHPRLIYCLMYGFAEEGPYAGLPAYDDLIQAMSGCADLQGRNKAAYEPEYVNGLVADKVSGLTAANAISMALFERERSGLGQAIGVPMFETMVAFNLIEHMGSATFNKPEPGMGYGRVLAPSRKPHRTQNGYIAILPYTTEQWRRFFCLSGHEHYTTQAAFMDPVARGQNISRLYDILASIMLERTTEAWLDLLAEADIPISKINTLEDLMADEQLIQGDFFQTVHHPIVGNIRMPGVAVRYSRTPGSIRWAAPTLDQDGKALKQAMITPSQKNDG